MTTTASPAPTRSPRREYDLRLAGGSSDDLSNNGDLGSSFADSLAGDSLANLFLGEAGND